MRTLVKSIRMDGANMVAQCCDKFQIYPLIKCMGNERLRKTRCHLGCRPREGEATCSVKGIVNRSKSMLF